MKRFLIFQLFLVPSLLCAQQWAGTWSGELTQDGDPKKYHYTVHLEQENGKLFGTSSSQEADSTGKATFTIGGIWDGATLTLQEVEQIEPANARWCLKHLRFATDGNANPTEIKGRWEAQGCTPGDIVLRKMTVQPVLPSNPVMLGQSGKPSLPGRFTGTLSQSDRDYGFYFEIQLNENGTGTSSITSDGEGGNAMHNLTWQWNEAKNEVALTETKVAEKSVADWPWCIKTASLTFQQDPNRLSLSGRWEGFIEGFTPKTGACAPGQLYLERPLFRPDEILTVQATTAGTPPATVPKGVMKYQKEEKREVIVDRVLEVKKSTVRVRVWDSGTIDGDILSLFVNGELILKNHRATRKKHETIIKLDKPTNYLILHAHNLGSISPNTVAVSVDDGHGEQVIIMSSNLSKSGAVMIRQFEVSE